MNTEEKSLTFVRYAYGDPLHQNDYSILEPIQRTHTIAPDQLDIVITPLIAFDPQGHRLGTGGGYYDRTFAFTQTPSHPKPHLLGCAYAAQQVAAIPADPWDVLLDAVVTEQTVIEFSK